MGRGRALLKCNIAVAGQYREYSYAKVSGWISNLGGNTSTSATTSTTHVVATEKAWKRKDTAVKDALRLNKEGEADIKIVSFDWLEDSVNNKTKKREGSYLWEKLDATLTKRHAAKAREEKTKKRKDHVGVMAEVFEEATKDYVDPKEAREIEKQIEEEKRVQAAMEEEKKRLEKEQKRLNHAERFKRGSKKALNEIFSENHHIYKDETMFCYEIKCTKVDTRNNRLARIVLTFQIYESNAEPRTYAVNYHYDDPNKEGKNEIISPIGSSFSIAFRIFKKAFKERTGVEWDDRITAVVERRKDQKRDRGMATGSEDLGSGKGVAVSSQADEQERKKREDKEFIDMPFEYRPPDKGPKGLLPKDQKLPEELVRGSNAVVEQWMRDARPDSTEVDVQARIATHGHEALQAVGNGEATNFDVVVHGDNISATGNQISSIFDKDISHWVNNNLDDQYPFDHHAENVAFLNAGNENQVNDAFSPTDTLTHGADASFNQDITNEQNGTSFTKPNEDTNIAEQPISFDLTSTIQDSFAPGTQDVTDTQMAERAQGEFDEFINHTSVDSVDSPYKDFLDLNTSVLGKRKAADSDDETDAIGLKKARQDLDEDEAFALAAPEAFDADGEYNFTTSSYAFDDESMPRTLFSENDLFSSGYLTADTEATEVEDGGEVVQYGRA